MDMGEGPAYGVLSAEDRNWGVAAHASAVLGAWIALGLIGPLIVLLARGGQSPFVRSHAVEALNFNISVLIYSVVGWVLVFVAIGIPILIAVGLMWLVCTVLGILKASKGEPYRYPLSIRLVS